MNKTIVITGAGGLLCSTLSAALAKEGHRVAALDLRKEAADGETKNINAQGGNAIGIVRDDFEVFLTYCR